MHTLFIQTKISNPQNREKGFTLIELMVSLTIFSMVMVVSIGTLLTLIDVNAKAQALYTASSNLAFALDSMTRELRTGYHYYCDESASHSNLPEDNSSDDNPTRDCDDPDNPGVFIAFTREKDKRRVGYRLNGDSIEVRIEEQNGALVQGWTPITADNVVVTSLDIIVWNSDTFFADNDTDQPSVDLRIKAYVNNGLETNTDFNIQTRIVARRLDLL